jgi:hypothetical protein
MKISESPNRNSINDDDVRWAKAVEDAEANNCDIEIADDYTLQLDLDSELAEDIYAKQYNRLKMVLEAQENRIDSVEHRVSKSGNKHIIIKLRNTLGVKDRILLQACLGSDLTREILSYLRVLWGNETPILLFVPRYLSLEKRED